jgi:hypothetical protein
VLSTRSAILGAVTVTAALGLAGCADTSGSATPPPAPLTTPAAALGPPPSGQLPDPAALTGILYQLADTTVPGTAKLALVEDATADDAAAFDRLGKALQDNGFTPLAFNATDLAWSDRAPGDVVATVSINSSDPASGGFSFPMDFRPYRGGWQLSKDTADLLMTMGSGEN